MWNFKISQSEYIVGSMDRWPPSLNKSVRDLSVNQKNCTILFILADSELPAPPCDG